MLYELSETHGYIWMLYELSGTHESMGMLYELSGTQTLDLLYEYWYVI